MLDDPGITEINLTTGPQAITGSTRMQATTIETYVVGAIVETAVERALGGMLGAGNGSAGFARRNAERGSGATAAATGVAAKLGEFGGGPGSARRGPGRAGAPSRTSRPLPTRERHFSTYFAENGLITVFIDSTERSPTFRLFPLDTVEEPRRAVLDPGLDEGGRIRPRPGGRSSAARSGV